jgi:hypothetical protein
MIRTEMLLLLLGEVPCLMLEMPQTMTPTQSVVTVLIHVLMPSQQPTPCGLLLAACRCPSLAPAAAQQLQHRQQPEQALQALQVCLSPTWATSSLLAP